MLVSAFAFGGIPEKAIKKAFSETDIYVSPSLLNEYREVPLILADGRKLTNYTTIELSIGHTRKFCGQCPQNPKSCSTRLDNLPRNRGQRPQN